MTEQEQLRQLKEEYENMIIPEAGRERLQAGIDRARMEKKIDDLCVIFTGGDAKYFAKRIKNTIFANCNLVFCGLDRILEYNASEEHLD